MRVMNRVQSKVINLKKMIESQLRLYILDPILVPPFKSQKRDLNLIQKDLINQKM